MLQLAHAGRAFFKRGLGWGLQGLPAGALQGKQGMAQRWRVPAANMRRTKRETGATACS